MFLSTKMRNLNRNLFYYFIVLYINESKDKIVLDLMNQYNNDAAFKGKIQVIYIILL